MWLFQFLIALFGFKKPVGIEKANENRKFLILIPAHNEGKVIGNLLESLKKQSYPKEYYDIVVSCDNCTDNTVEVVKQHGISALVRKDEEKKGKTWNIQWAMKQVNLSQYDSVLFFDADNVVDPYFLGKMNDYIEANPNTLAIQGHLQVKNLNDSWITDMYALTYWFQNIFWNIGRSNLKMSVLLGGTGMLIRTSCLQMLPWKPKSLTEDLEYSAALISKGHKIDYNYWAICYDEKPVTMNASNQQRSRWLQGHYWVLMKYFKIIVKLLFNPKKSSRLQALDLLINLSLPGKMSIYLIVQYLWIVPGILLAFSFNTFYLYYFIIVFVLSLVQIVIFYIVGPTKVYERFHGKYLKNYYKILWYALNWLPKVIRTLFKIKDQTNWNKTEHSRNIKINDIK